MSSTTPLQAAADDWSADLACAFEMTSVFIEDEVFDDDNQYVDRIADFRRTPVGARSR